MFFFFFLQDFLMQSETCERPPTRAESVQMGKGDTALTRISKVTPAAASHLSNTLDFRKPSDVAFTATLNSGEPSPIGIGRRVAALALDNSTGHSAERQREEG